MCLKPIEINRLNWVNPNVSAFNITGKIKSIITYLLLTSILLVNVFAIHKDVTNEVIPIISERLQAELEIAHDNDLFPVIVWFIDDSSYQIEVQLEDIVGYSKYEWKTDIIKQSSIDQIHSYKLLKAEVATEHYNLINQGYIDCYLSDS